MTENKVYVLLGKSKLPYTKNMLLGVYATHELASSAMWLYEKYYPQYDVNLQVEPIHESVDHIKPKGNLPTIWAISALKVDLVTYETTLFMDPNGEKLLKNLTVPVNPRDHLMTVVVCQPTSSMLDASVRVFMEIKEEDAPQYVKNVLDKKLKEMGLRRFDLFCTLSPVFRDNIVPLLQDIPGTLSFSYCVID